MSEAEQPTEPASDPARTRRRVWLVVAGVCGALILATAILRVTRSGSDAGAASGQKAAVVRTTTVQRDTLRLTAEYRGELTSDAAELAAQITGRLSDVKVNIGDAFKAGQLLARIDAIQAERQITEARADVRASEASQRRSSAELKAAKAELERGKRLFAEGLVTEQELTTLRSRVDVLDADGDGADAALARAKARVGVLREQANEAKLEAPFDGAVAERYLDPGALVQPGTTVLRLVKSGPLQVRFRVPERDLGTIEPGLAFEVTTQADEARAFAGKITRISAEVSRSDRTVAVEGVLDAETPSLKPGMYATVALGLETLGDADVVAASALVERAVSDKKQTGVFLLEGDRARWKAVEVVGRAGDRVALKGLAPGQQVLSFGHEALKDGAKVRVAGEPSP